MNRRTQCYRVFWGSPLNPKEFRGSWNKEISPHNLSTAGKVKRLGLASFNPPSSPWCNVTNKRSTTRALDMSSRGEEDGLSNKPLFPQPPCIWLHLLSTSSLTPKWLLWPPLQKFPTPLTQPFWVSSLRLGASKMLFLGCLATLMCKTFQNAFSGVVANPSVQCTKLSAPTGLETLI